MKGRKKPKAAAAAAEAESVDPAPKRRKKASKVVGGSYAVDSYLARLMSLKSRSRSADSDIAFVLAADEDAGLQPVKERISTGLLELDKFIGGGYPVGRIVELAAWENIGKALSLDTPVLTPVGFVPMRYVKEGSSVVGQNGLPTKVLGVYPQGSQPLYRLTFSDGAQTCSTADHLWTVRDYHSGAVTTRTLRDLRSAGLYHRNGKQASPKFAIPLAQPVLFAEQELPVDPYVLGLLLGDGDLSGSTIGFHKNEPDLLEALGSEIAVGERLSKIPSGVRIVRDLRDVTQRTQLAHKIEALGLKGTVSETKFVPDQYLRGSVAQRLALVRGLFDTDGHVCSSGATIEFSTVSEPLASGVTYLIWSLGGVAHLREKIPTYAYKGEKREGQLAYVILARFPLPLVPVSSVKHLAKWTRTEDSRPVYRTLTSIEPAGEAECQCIRVEAADGLFVIEDFIVTHNSTLIDQSIAMAQQSGAIVALIDSEKARDREYTRRLGVNLDELIIASIDTLEQGFEAADSMLAVQEAIMLEGEARARPFMLFWDSLGGTPTKAELEGAADDRHVATQAIMIKQNFRRLCMRLNELRGCLVFANQFYEKIGGMGGLATSGGSGVRYFTSLRLWMTKGNYLKSGTTDVGQIVNVKMRKTRLGSPKPPIELGLIFGSGFDNAWTLYEWGKVNGVGEKHRWIEQRGSWCYLTMPDTGEVHQWQGTYLGFSALLREQPQLYELLATLFLQESEQS